MSNGNKKKKKGNGPGVLAFGVTFVLLSSIFKIHGLIGLGVQLAVSAFVSAIVRTMAQGLDLRTLDQKKKDAEAEQAAQQQAQQQQAAQKRAAQQDSLTQIKGSTGNPEADALLEKGRQMILVIREENAKIPDTSLTQKLDTLEGLCAEVFRAVKDKPAKAPQIRKFMEYYLPTTLKMVKSYRMLGDQTLSGSDVADAKARIDSALGVVIKGCRKMLTNLYKDDVLDITTDIDVLEQMLKRDGLTESDLELAAEQAKQAARIDATAQASRQAAAQQAAQQRPAAQTAAVQPASAQPTPAAASVASGAVPTFHVDSGVKGAVNQAATEAQRHVPQVPTISGEMYPPYGGQATAQAPKPE